MTGKVQPRRQPAGRSIGYSCARCPWLSRSIRDDLGTGCPQPAVARLATALSIDRAGAAELLAGYGGWQGRTAAPPDPSVGPAGLALVWHRGAQSCSMSSCSPGRWSTTHPAFCCSWPATGCAPSASLANCGRSDPPGRSSARDAARSETYQRLAALLAPPRPRELDALLDVDDELRGTTRLAWLRRGATAATPEVLKAELDKLEILRRHGADRLDLSMLPTGRRRMLAEIGRRSTNQALQRADVDRRHPVLLATLAETYVEVLDELVQLLDRALAGADSRARHELAERMLDRARAEVNRGRLLDEVLEVLADLAVPDEQVGRLVRARIGMDCCRPPCGPTRTGHGAITVTWNCSPPATGTCVPSPRPCWPRCL